MDDKVRVEDAKIESVSCFDIGNPFVANLKTLKWFTVLLNLEKISQKWNGVSESKYT